jgi:glycine oxidase
MDDCLIVGAGVIGLSLAYELSGRGLRVRVLDRQEAGAEASWAGAGILPPAGRGAARETPLSQLAAISARLHPQWSEHLREETGIDNEYRRCGGWSLVVAGLSDTSPLGDVKAHIHASASGTTSNTDELWAEHSYSPVTFRELEEREPALADARRNGRILAAAFADDEAQLRNPRHLQALVAACRRRGVVIETNIEVMGFWSSAGQVVGAQTSSGPKYAGSFCITTGAWSGRLAETIGVKLKVKPIRGQIVLLQNTAPALRHIVNVGKRYLVPRLDGRVLVGSTEEDAGFERQTTAQGIDGLLAFAHALIPNWSEARVEKAWAGLRPATPDELPYLGRAPALSNLFIAAGHFRSGIYLSPGTAVVMSQLICGERPSIDLAPFAVNRHAESVRES